MGFKYSNETVYGINSAVIKLKGQFINLEDFENKRLIIVDDPVIVVDLLSIDELKRYANLSKLSEKSKVDIENVIVRDKVVEVVGYKDKNICIPESPAGVISTIAGLIFNKSYDYIANVEINYGYHISDVTPVDQMCAIISYYTSTPYDIVKELPISEIFKRHAICARAFPNQVNDIRNKDIGQDYE